MNSGQNNMINDFSVLLDDWLVLYQQTRKPEIIARMCHEIKNPIGLIRSTLQLIESQTPEVRDNKHWSSLYEELDYVSLLLDDFNSYNRSINIHKKSMDISSILDSLTECFYSVAYEKNINLYVTKTKHLPPILGDETRLKEVFFNLIKNALEATDTEGTIAIDIKHLNDFIIITINDTGIGISEEHLKDIFEPFITYKENGTGLGLPIVKTIIEQHNGTINVTSKVNEGTSFIISLPTDTN
jgi:signal transduction histidine kinase